MKPNDVIYFDDGKVVGIVIEILEKEKMQLSAILENKSFVDRAPKDVVDGAKQRLADTLSDIETYQEQLGSISKLLP